MNSITLEAKGISKEFNRRKIFSGVSFSLFHGGSLAITGRNGAGKSTLAKIVCGVLTPTSGTVSFSCNGAVVPMPHIHRYVGFVSPYIHLYDEFTALENLHFIAAIRGVVDPKQEKASALLSRFGIFERARDEVRTYSSGMKQRLKYAAALLHDPVLLVVDEPTSNLDEQGIQTVRAVMEEQKSRGILLVATNDREDTACVDQVIAVDGRGTP
jgi:heme exporter protein A